MAYLCQTKFPPYWDRLSGEVVQPDRLSGEVVQPWCTLPNTRAILDKLGSVNISS